jgi:uncharacterized DUF497 family protein
MRRSCPTTIVESLCWNENPTEERYVTFGMDAQGRVLAVSYALRGNTLRIISARTATSRERAQYEDKRI